MLSNSGKALKHLLSSTVVTWSLKPRGGWKRKHCVAELIDLGMVTSAKMIESEMGYCAANPFKTHNLSIIFFYFDEATAVKIPL
jgi:hypothetical protein